MTCKQTACTPPPAAYTLDDAPPICYHASTMLTSQPPGTHTARILRFADADTVVVLVKLNLGVHVEKYLRLSGIESHELNGPQRGQALLIRDELNKALGGRDCLVHLLSNGHDRYGRQRGRVTVGELDLAAWLVSKGWAWLCSPSESAAAHKRNGNTDPHTEAAQCTDHTPQPASPRSPSLEVTSNK